MSIKLDWDPGKGAGVISGEYFDELREHFSVKNDAAKFIRYRGGYAPAKRYAITPTGRFEVGMVDEIENYVFNNGYQCDILKTQEFSERAHPPLPVSKGKKLKLTLRDYQEDIVNECTERGRGVVVLATAGGKTLTMATLLQRIYAANKDFKCALIVPDRGLVEQTYNNFIDYGVHFSFSKWTGGHDLNLGSNVIICNLGILQSSKSDTDWLSYVDVCVVDEVHKLRKGNKVNKLFKGIRTHHRFGFTGTMPEDLIDQWNILGKIGPLIYEKNSFELRRDEYIANVKVQILQLEYESSPKYPRKLEDPAQRYRCELDFIIHNDFRNNIISSLCTKFDRNSLILVDYIEHGNILHKHLSSRCRKKKCYFIRGEVAVEDREKVKRLMEEDDDIIVVAISKIFSTGIDIKNLHYIIFASGGKAKIKVIQSIGRGLRLHDNKTKLIIFDIGDELQYGRQHLAKRTVHYKKENIEYGSQSIKENTTSKKS